MALSLFSRDTLALSTAVALSHGMFDSAALLGICEKIVPGPLIDALRFGHLPTILVPARAMAASSVSVDRLHRNRRLELRTVALPRRLHSSPFLRSG
ncbi:dihydroxyacid dehydratase/phosphogluconate dehydratase [Novosphingobium sp. SG751A]|nr:dihydroxyacid dehydratase/phosphogluconate dehydratase [Novosphingobium sp. SG751A]